MTDILIAIDNYTEVNHGEGDFMRVCCLKKSSWDIEQKPIKLHEDGKCLKIASIDCD